MCKALYFFYKGHLITYESLTTIRFSLEGNDRIPLFVYIWLQTEIIFNKPYFCTGRLSSPGWLSKYESKLVTRILQGNVSFEKIQKATQYKEMIEPRLKALIHLKNSLDSEFTLYSYMPRMYPFITSIKADYLVASHTDIDSFIFLIQATPQGNSKCDFLCCSTFEQGERNYEANQRSRTLLKKERIHIPTNTSLILLDNLKSV